MPVASGTVRLADSDPASTGTFHRRSEGRAQLARDLTQLAALQDVLYAGRQYAALIVFQGMDAAGKDGTIGHVMCAMKPQGVDVRHFTPPSAEEVRHDYLWRCANVLPARGNVTVFNRSYYEELTVVRVNETLLAAERVPPVDAKASIWRERYEDIVAFEQHLVRNGTIVIKFFLHISKEEQRKRFLARIDNPAKQWKIAAADLDDRLRWNDFRDAYDHVLSNTSPAFAPWHIIPADHKWYAHAAVARIIVEKLASLGLAYPALDRTQRAGMAVLRDRLTR